MRLAKLRARNYRTLEDLTIEFSGYFTAICGRNDAGKSNVVRAIRATMRFHDDDDDAVFYSHFERPISLNIKDDFPKWRTQEPTDKVELEVEVEVDGQRDGGLHNFIVSYLRIDPSPDSFRATIRVEASRESPGLRTTVLVDGREFGGLQADEVVKKVQSSRCLFLHNSTQMSALPGGYIREYTPEAENPLRDVQAQVEKAIRRYSRAYQDDIEALLGRLESKYKVGLTLPTFNLEFLPLNITLGERSYEVPLHEWGSGTRNRTSILLTLIRARKIADLEATASKVTPIILIEEPESFLHPSAQAEFGRVLQDLAEEFRVQVVITTHSPYLLNQDRSTSNILLRRRPAQGRLRETQRVETDGTQWMEPFGVALGLSSESFRPWKNLFEGPDVSEILLVEGATDREYLELLRRDEHGSHALQFRGEIFSYDGCSNLKNTLLLRFIVNRYKRVIITFDLDVREQVEGPLRSLGLRTGHDYFAVGVDAPGMRSIEGMVPERFRRAVFAENPALVTAQMSDKREERDAAKCELKKLILEHFRTSSAPTPEDFGPFYDLSRKMNIALRAKPSSPRGGSGA